MITANNTNSWDIAITERDYNNYNYFYLAGDIYLLRMVK
jgi:hypothetical protein